MTLRVIAFLTFVAGIAISVPGYSGPLSIGPFTFPLGEAAFVDEVTYLSGEAVYIGHDPGESWHFFNGNTTTDLNAALTGSDISVGLGGGGINVDLHFIDNLVINGLGADLVVFETVSPETFALAVLFEGSVTPFITYESVFTGFTVGGVLGTSNTAQLNAAAIDLNDFGLADGEAITGLRLNTAFGGIPNLGTTDGADIVAIGALNSAPIPEPSTLLLLGTGLAGLWFFRRRKRRLKD